MPVVSVAVDLADSGDPARLELFLVIGIVAVVAAGAFSKRFRIAAPLLLILIGVGVSFIPGAPSYVPHELILMGFLPPILYSAALNVPLTEFRRNFRSITALSVALVVVTAFAVGGVLFVLFPDLGFPAALALGAVISPTDAVAATALGKRLGLSPRLVALLEGESLVNDATALVLLRSALAATAATLSFWEVAWDFAFAVTAAIVIGLVVGVITVWVRSRLNDPLLDTAVSFMVPFIAYLPTQFLDASGVLAVVVAGLYAGHSSARRFSAQSRIAERLNWRTVQYILENGVFLLMGLQLSYLVADVWADDLSADEALLYGLLVVVVVLVVRFLFIGPLLIAQRLSARQFDRREPWYRHRLELMRVDDHRSPVLERRVARFERVLERRRQDFEALSQNVLGWRGGLVLGWAGMRGVVTLAAAQSIPPETPYRSQLILLAFTVALVTLLLQGGTLPALIRLLGLQGVDRSRDSKELAGLLDEVAQAGVSALDDAELRLPDGEPFDPEVLERVRNDTMLSAAFAWDDANRLDSVEESAPSPQRQYRMLRGAALAAEREALLEARAAGRYPSRLLSRAQRLLDIEETRLQELDDPDGS